MTSLEYESGCLTCFQQTGCDLLNVQGTAENTIADVLRKHFWFTEVDFQQATICQPCWNQVNEFHRFYVSVQELHQNRLVSLIEVKSEVEPEMTGGSGFMVELVPGISIVETVPRQSSISAIKCDETVETADELNKPINNDSDIGLSGVKEDAEKMDTADEVHNVPLVKQGSDKHNSKAKNKSTAPVKSKIRKPKPKKNKSTQQSLIESTLDDEYINKHIKYVCDECDHESRNFTLFLQHGRAAHAKKSVYLLCCGKRFYKKVRLLEHVQAFNKPDIFRCEQCKKNFSYKYAMLRHMKEFHPLEEECTFKCNRCPKSFALQCLYNVHMEDHEKWDNKGWECKYCGKSYLKKPILNHHIKMHHVKPKVRFICDICSRGFCVQSRFLQHMQKHANPADQRMQCELCLQWLKNKNSWRCHVKQQHTNNAKFPCKVCAHVLFNEHALKTHMRRHHRGTLSKAKPDASTTPSASQES